MKALSAIALICGFLGCTKTNPDLCCTDEANCQSLGIPTSDMCSDGLVCRGNQCIAETCAANTDCDASLPFCSSDMLCAATCDDNSQCPGFGEDATDVFCSSGACVQCLMNSDCSGATPVCSNNACVQCVANTDCSGATPVCDANACRVCQADSECASGVCNTDGTCDDAADDLFTDPAGTDAGSCTQDAPCKTLAFALSKISTSRFTVSMAMGTYAEAPVIIRAADTTATNVDIHGHGSTINASYGDNYIYEFEINATLRDLVIHATNGGGAMLNFPSQGGLYEIDNVSLDGADGVFDAGTLTARNVTVFNVDVGIEVGGVLDLDGAVVHDTQSEAFIVGLFNGQATPQASVQAKNMMIYNAGSTAIDVEDGIGSISFTTVYNTLTDAGTEPFGVTCVGSGVRFTSMIVWGTGTHAAETGCTFTTSIVGVAGSGTDPQFVDPATDNLHLAQGSPAIDAVPTGPATDFEGDIRPQGSAYDIGADEYKP
jgi:hypothetical protein